MLPYRERLEGRDDDAGLRLLLGRWDRFRLARRVQSAGGRRLIASRPAPAREDAAAPPKRPQLRARHLLNVMDSYHRPKRLQAPHPKP